MEQLTARKIFEDFVPERIGEDRELAESISGVYEFKILGEGTWTLDFTGDVGIVREGESPEADCFIELDGDQVPEIMDNPMKGLRLLMTGQLKIAGEYSLAEHLIKVFGNRDGELAST